METIVGVVRGNEKFQSFQELIKITSFNETLLEVFEKSKKQKNVFKIAIKPNMMVFTNPKNAEAIVTDKDLVEFLVNHIIKLGFSDIVVCEAQNDVGRMLKNHNVSFVSQQIGYNPKGQYKIADLTLETIPYQYRFKDKKGNQKKWKDGVGKSWLDADFRISFAKCKTHEHDWMTLGLKNVYGCFPRADKVAVYHIKYEVWDVTARSILNFPINFSFIDAWIGSDGFQGYKIPHLQKLNILFGGSDAVAVDMEVFKRAELDPYKSKFINRVVKQLSDGKYPQYSVKGDQSSKFSQISNWQNIDDKIVEAIDIMEEVYIAWGFINLKATSRVVDFSLFPPKNIFYRFLVWLSKKLYGFFKLFKFYRKIYQRRKRNIEAKI